MFINDLTRKPGSRVELGAEMHKFLAENPDAIPTIAVEMIVAVVYEVAVDQDEAVQLQWQVTEAMTEKLNDKQKDAIMGTIPMKRMGAGAEVAAAVAYLASEEAAYVTGQTMHVNGGMAMF